MARSLPPDFPGLAALQAAGEATPAKVRKRIADNTLSKIDQIGPATADQIKAAFEEFDSPDVQAEDQKDAEAADGKPSDTIEEGEKRVLDDEHPEASTIVNQGSHAAEVRSRSDAENQKSSGDVAQEQPNHALDRPAGANTASGVMSDAERLAHCGAVYVDAPTGAYASAKAVQLAQRDGRFPILPVSRVAPRTGMEIRDGEDVYALAEGFGRDTQPIDWLRVRSPNTGKPFIE
jgi:hypothetical protein